MTASQKNLALTALCVIGLAQQTLTTVGTKALACGLALLGMLAGYYMRVDRAYRNPENFPPLSGIHLYLGWSAGAQGMYARHPEISDTPAGHAFDGRLWAQHSTGSLLSVSEANSYFVRAAWDEVSADPLRALRLALRKLRLFFTNEEVRSDEYLPFLREKSVVLSIARLGHGFWLIAAVIGIWLMVLDGRRTAAVTFSLMIVAVAVSNVLGFVNWRYRLPSLIPMTVAAAYAFARSRALLDTLRSERRPRIELVALLAAAGALAFSPVLSSNERERMMVSSRHSARWSERAEAELSELASVTDERRKFVLLSSLQLHSRAYELASAHPLAPTSDASSMAAWLKLLVWNQEFERARQLEKEFELQNPELAALMRSKLSPLIRRVLEWVAMGVPASGGGGTGSRGALRR